MRSGERIPLLVKICLPLLFLVLFRASPVSEAVVQGLREARQAQRDRRPEAQAAALRSVLLHESWRVELWEQVGRQEYAAGRTAAAVEALARAEQAGALSADGYLLLGDLYVLQKDPVQAEAAWRAQMRLAGPSTQVYDRLVQLQRKQGKIPAAIETLRAWRGFDPRDARVAYLLGMFLSVTQPDQAPALLLEAAQKDSQYSSAVQTLRGGLAVASTSPEPAYGWLMIGRALGSIEQWDLAEEAFKRSVTEAENYAEAWAFLGEARSHLGSTGKAELDRAVLLNEESPVVRALLALYWRRQGDPQKAVTYLQQIASREPEEPTWQLEIGNTQVEIGDLEAARQSYQKAVDLSPKNGLYWQYLARFSVNYNVDIRSLGLPAARQAVLLSPDDPAALDVMGWTMANLGDGASAERFLQRALERDATNATISLHLGQLYLQQQDTEQAHLYLTRAASLAGDTPVGKVARRLLLRYYGEGG